MAGADCMRADVLGGVRGALDLHARVRGIVLSLALRIGLRAGAFCDVLVELKEGLHGALGGASDGLGHVCEGETGEGSEIVEEFAGLGREARPDDGEEGAESACEVLRVSRCFVGSCTGRRRGGRGVGDVGLREVPKGLLNVVVAWRRVSMERRRASKRRERVEGSKRE